MFSCAYPPRKKRLREDIGTSSTKRVPSGETKIMMLVVSRDLNIAYAFFERNWNLIRRYIGWEIVWIMYSLVNALTILFIAAATERITGQAVDTRFFVLYLLIGTTMWSYLSAVFDVVAETIAWERWEGTIEYTLMAPGPRSLHLIGTCSYAVTYAVVRSTIMFAVVALLFGVD